MLNKISKNHIVLFFFSIAPNSFISPFHSNFLQQSITVLTCSLNTVANFHEPENQRENTKII
jgi:hypothetical protein